MGLFKSIVDRFKSREINWEDLEETLITGDLGVKLTTELVERLQRRGKLDSAKLAEACREEIRAILGAGSGASSPGIAPAAPIAPAGFPTVILIAGVNGVGKTTSVAKLAGYLKRQNKKVVLAAADTFRAAAIKQLTVWANRLEVPLVSTHYQGDPSAVCYDAHKKAIAEGADYLVCDTAGRLHTRHNLMEELRKIRRTIAKQDPSAPHERWVVVDATTGSNALSQAREFQSALDLNGVIVTKLDGSGKGGSLVAIRHELGVPTRFIGTGENVGDFRPFEIETFLDELL